MASTTSGSRGLPPPHSHAHFLSSPSSTFLDNRASSCLHIPSVYSPAADAQDPSAPTSATTRRNKQTRKRPRPSCRLPTTVLTTDASNFRAMVQEFTGFSAPPPFAHPPRPHVLPGGVLTAAAPSHFNPRTASHASPPPSAATRNATMPAADSGAAVHSSESGLYGSFGPVVGGAVPFDGCCESAGDLYHRH